MRMHNGSRRAFLSEAAIAAGMIGAGAVRFAHAARGRWALRFSGSSINFSRLPIEQACEKIAALGFEAVDVWSAHAGCPHLDDVQARLGADGLRALLERHKLNLCAFSVYAGGYPRYAELLGSFGGGLAIQGGPGPCEPSELTTRMKAFFESLKPQIELAERHQSFLAIENHGQSLLDSIDSIKAFVDLCPSPRLGLALAPFHVQARGESVPAAIEAAGSRLRFFYAWQHDPAMSTRQLPGIGPTDCREWLAALARVNYTGHVNPFLHDEPPPDEASAALARSRDALLAWYDQAVPA